MENDIDVLCEFEHDGKHCKLPAVIAIPDFDYKADKFKNAYYAVRKIRQSFQR